MRFGGHETFPVREGWLYKGLRLLGEEPEKLAGEMAADELGVGNNMAKSIRHWLLATGLATQTVEKALGALPRELEATQLGKLIGEHDPFFLEVGTWWALHLNLISAPTHVLTWVWFFNHFSLDRFERPVCFEALKRHLQMKEKRLPSQKTLERDLACLLASYARTVPPRRSDPEDVEESPFVELGILTHFRSSGWYEVNRGHKDVPPELLGYALNRVFEEEPDTSAVLQVPLMEALRLPSGPGRGFVLTADALFELVGCAERQQSTQIRVSGLAGERTILCPRKPSVEWLKEYYRRIAGERQDAA
jgi:hypothetical protein